MGNTINFNTGGSIALAINYEIQGPYSDKFLTKQAATTLRVNKEVFIRVDDAVFCVNDADVDLTAASDLDTGSSFDASETYYVYACQPLDGTLEPDFKISKNATYPAGGWTADNSRKIGGFETDGAAEISESTVWDLRSTDLDGMVITENENKTIASGEITSAGTAKIRQITVDTQDSDPTDDLDKINSVNAGDLVILRAANEARTVVVKNGTHIKCGTDFSLDSVYDTITLLCIGSDTCVQIARSSNA